MAQGLQRALIAVGTVFCIVLTGFPVLSWASASEPPSLYHSRRQFQTYLMVGGESRLNAVDRQKLSGGPAVLMALGLIYEYSRGFDPSQQERTARALKVALRMVVRTDPQRIDPYMFDQIQIVVQHLLQAYWFPGEPQRVVLSMYYQLRLWGQRDFWFLITRLGDEARLANLYGAFNDILPQLTEEQKSELEEAIRKTRRRTFLQLGLLMKMDRLKPGEQQRFLEDFSTVFAHTVRILFLDTASKESYIFLQPYQNRGLEDQFNTLSELILQRMQDDRSFLLSFRKARRHIERTTTKNSWKHLRLRFFDLLEQDLSFDQMIGLFRATPELRHFGCDDWLT